MSFQQKDLAPPISLELKDNKRLYQKKILLPLPSFHLLPFHFTPWYKSKSKLLDISMYFITPNYFMGYIWIKLTWSHWYITTSSLEGVHSIRDSCRIHTDCSNSDTCKSHSSFFHTENSTFSMSTRALSSPPTPVLSQGSSALHQGCLLYPTNGSGNSRAVSSLMFLHLNLGASLH